MATINYKNGIKGDFFFTVNERVEDYFNSRNLSKKTNLFGIFKALFFCSTYLILYFLVLTASGQNSLLISSFALMGFIQICIVLNLGHEGVHGAFSHKKWVNNLLCYSFDLIGSSGYLWKMRHIYSHHKFPMIPEHDVDIQQTGMLTFQPLESPKPAFRYQNIYAPFLYCAYTLNAIFRRDFQDFFSGKIGDKALDHSPAGWFSFVFSKILYFTYALILPLLLSGCSVPMVLMGFVGMHVAASITAAVALFPAHLHEDAIFPSPDENGAMPTTWAEHQMSVTMDFGTRFPWVGFFFGGINYHAVHHIFPMVAHVHFPAIRKILKTTATEFGIAYHHKPSLNAAVYSHWLLLRKNGMAHVNEII